MSLGFIFPGQGSQSVGMLAELARRSGGIRDRFIEAGELIGQPLWEIVAEGPEDRLNSTEITQPALLAASFALWETWLEAGGNEPTLLAGHSLGEYSALVCAGALSFADGVQLVHQRGKFMQAAVPRGEGAMAAILGLEDAQIAECCGAVDGVVTPANFNAPGQVVIAGSAAAVELAIAACKAAGARRAVLLPVSVPSHCALMAPAQQAFAQALEQVDLRLPRIPVVHNVDAAVADSVEALTQKLLAQLAEPVQWTRCVQTMTASGIDALVECGPGRVLAGLVKRIARDVAVSAIDAPAELDAALASHSHGQEH